VQAVDIEIQAKEIMYHKANLNGIMAEYTGQPIDKVRRSSPQPSCHLSRLALLPKHAQCHNAWRPNTQACFCLLPSADVSSLLGTGCTATQPGCWLCLHEDSHADVERVCRA